jgi:hypothetical protein
MFCIEVCMDDSVIFVIAGLIAAGLLIWVVCLLNKHLDEAGRKSPADQRERADKLNKPYQVEQAEDANNQDVMGEGLSIRFRLTEALPGSVKKAKLKLF